MGAAGLSLLVITFLLSAFFEGGLKRFFFAYLLNFSFFLSLSLGALFFVALQHITRAGWSVTVRRLAEIIAANLQLLAFLFIPLIFGLGQLYIWADPNAVSHDSLLQWKRPYLNIPFFIIRCILYFSILWFFSNFFLKKSIQQDKTGDVQLSLSMERMSPAAIILVSLTITFLSFDLLMSLDPHWFSTIYGVYYFSGCLVGFLALLAVLSILLQQKGVMEHVITTEHYHDIGKFLFGFIFFWAYIAFSQYMLIWYANIPEESLWIVHRQHGAWKWIALILIFGHFVIPFVALLSRYPKRRKTILAGWAIWMIVMHWIDLYWLIMPEFSHDRIPIHIVDIACLLGLGALYGAGLLWTARDCSLLPIKDPRLTESLNFENA